MLIYKTKVILKVVSKKLINMSHVENNKDNTSTC